MHDMHDDNSEQLIDYADMAVRLHGLAAVAKDPAVAVQLIDLATRYEVLAAKAAEMSEQYLPAAPGSPASF
jgi:hypothetical protein